MAQEAQIIVKASQPFIDKVSSFSKPNPVFNLGQGSLQVPPTYPRGGRANIVKNLISLFKNCEIIFENPVAKKTIIIPKDLASDAEPPT